MSAEILSCGCPVPLDDDGCCTSCGWFPGMTEVATMTKPTPKQAVSAAPIPQGRSVLAVMSCLRDSAQLSTLPAWCRGELSTAADMIAEQAAALAASEARVAELQERLADTANGDGYALDCALDRVGVLEQSLAEAVKDAERWRWLRGNVWAGWMRGEGFFLNCDEPETEWDAAIDALLQEANHAG